jgi:hypothetical protein
MAVTHITVARGAHDVLLQAARIGAPTVDQLRMMVARAPSACVTVGEVDAKAAKILDYCAIRKLSLMHQHPYKAKAEHAAKPGALTFADYFGPFRYAAIGTNGVHGLLAVVDENSDFAIAAMAKHRRTADWLAFADVAIMMYKRHGWVLEQLLTDRPPELYSAVQGGDGLDPSVWMVGLRDRGVQAQYSHEYQPQTHGRVEILWQVAQAGGRARMRRTALNDSFFLWAMLDAARVRNAYCGRDEKRSRYEIFTGEAYPAGDDRVWGSFGHCWVPPEKRAHKGSPVSMPCVYVGKGQPGWRVIVGQGATAYWMDVARATFYEVPLISKGLMPSATVTDAETQTVPEPRVAALLAALTAGGAAPVVAPIVPVATPVAGGVAALAGAHALPAVPAVIRQTPAAWAATLRPRRSAAAMIAAARCVVEETEMCSEGPAMRVCSDAQAAALVRGGEEAMHQVARAEACVVMMLSQSSERVAPVPRDAQPSAQPKVKKAPLMQTFNGPQGEYRLPVPKNFNDAMSSPQAAHWWAAMSKAIVKFEAAGHFVPMSRAMVPVDAKVWPSTWALTFKSDAETGELREYKVRPSFDGRSDDEDTYFAAPASMIEVLATLAATVVQRRVCGAADVSDAYTEAKRPGAEWRYMRMMQGFTRRDAAGETYVYGLPWNFWGERAGGRNFERHKNDLLRARGYVKAPDTVNIFTRPMGDGMATMTNVTDDFLVTADPPAEGPVEANAKAVLADVCAMFTKVKTCLWPTAFNGLKLTWVLAADGRPLSVTVACPDKVMQLVAMLGGEQAVIEGAGDGKVTRDLLELAAVPADEMTERGVLTRRATGLLQWMSPVRLETKLFVHVLSRVMKAPSDEASDVVYRVALGLMRSAEDGLTFGGADRAWLELSGAYKALPSNVRMADGSPWETVGVYDATWGEPHKSVATSIYTVAGAAVDAATVSIPGVPISSAEAEIWAQSWSLARGLYVLGVLRALGMIVPARVPHMGDNSTAVDLAADNASATDARHILRRIAFSQELCDADDGAFAPVKVGTDDNASDFMGKLVAKEKILRSLNWAMGREQQPSDAVLRAGRKSQPVADG